MKKNNKILLTVGIGLMVIAIVNLISKNSDLKRNGVIINATILAKSFSAKSSVLEFKYKFEYAGKIYIGFSDAGVEYSDEFIGKSFPMIFSPKTGNSQILIVPRHFEKYNEPYPDSLNWVKKYIINGF